MFYVSIPLDVIFANMTESCTYRCLVTFERLLPPSSRLTKVIRCLKKIPTRLFSQQLLKQ